MGQYVTELRRTKPPWLHGYPSALALVAAYLVENSIDLGYPVHWITIGAENLLPQQSVLLEKAFGVRPKQHYGMVEAVANASECEHGKLHVDEDFAAVEFVRDPHGEGWRVVGTNFTNLATPMLRYDVGDVVTLSNATCSCGRPGRVVESVDGRKDDYVVLHNGVRLGRMDHIFKDLTHVREAQIYQERPGEIIIRVVPGPGYDEEDECLLLAETKKRIGNETSIIVQYLDKLQRTQVGKLRLVVSEIPDAKISREG